MKRDTLMTPCRPVPDQPDAITALDPWFHNLHLPDGTQTAPAHPLGDFPRFKWEQIAPHLPPDLSGWTALDIGCNAGFYTIELARRGAQVTALDLDPHFLRQARWALRQFGLEDRVQLRQGQVYELAAEKECYDLVVFMGVFYHLRYPLLALDILAERVKRLMLFQTLTLPGEDVHAQVEDQSLDERASWLEPGWPKMAFLEHAVAGDATNWWAPNHAGIEAMLRSSGLSVAARPGHEIYLCRPLENFRSRRQWRREEMLAATGQPARSQPKRG